MPRFALSLLLLCACADEEPHLRIGSKKFTESVVLGELARGLAATEGVRAEHRMQLGGTRVLWNALQGGDIDLYPEYTGTITEEILGDTSIGDLAAIRAALAAEGIRAGGALGFNNTYAIGMKEKRAAELGVTRVSDLARHPTLRFGFTSEFMDRSIQEWLKLGIPADPIQAATDALQDAVFDPGLHPDTDPITPATDMTAAVLHHDTTIKPGRAPCHRRPALERHIDIGGVDVEPAEPPPGPLGGDQRGARAEERIKHELAAARHVLDRVRNERRRLDCRVQRQILAPAAG